MKFLRNQHSTPGTQHSIISTQHSTLNTQHSALNTQHSTLNTQHSSCLSPILRFILSLSLTLCFQYRSNAQWLPPCEDPTRLNPYFQCYEGFFPVCGCTQKTYRNGCVSYNVFGVNNIISDGVCQNDVFYFEINPNPAVEKTTFNIKFFDFGNYSIQIFDNYGKLMYYDHQASVRDRQDDIYLTDFRPGFYIFTIISGNIFRTKKLMVR